MYKAIGEEPGDIDRILASASVEGRPIEIIEHPDGSLVIQMDGSEIPQFRWGRGQVEACVHTYLHLLRR